MTRIPVAAVWISIMAMLIAVPANADPPPPPAYSPDIDLTASVWQTFTGGSANVPLYNDANGGLYLDFPVMPNADCKTSETVPCDSINYLFTTHVPTSIRGALVITMTVETAGTPQFEYTGSSAGSPASVRAFFWSHYENYSNWNRWWSRDIKFDLAPGTVTLNIPLEPQNFGTVYGQLGTEDERRFYRSLDDVGAIGVTFGGGNHAGHGVFVTGGAARFTLQQYVAAPLCPEVYPCGAPGCLRDNTISQTSTGLDYCVTSAGDLFLDCDNGQTVNVVTSTCQLAPCCTADPACLCLDTCPEGQYLECH